MPKKNDGKKFEKLTKRVFEILTQSETHSSVEHDVRIEGADGPRQIDVLVRSTVAGIDILTIVECRDYQKKLTVTHVDGLHSKMQDVQAQKAVLVSPKGFSKTATKKANRLGITLATLEPAANKSIELQRIGADVPVVITEISDLQIKVGGSIATKNIRGSPQAMNGSAMTSPGTVNGVNLQKAIQDAFLSGELPKSTNATGYDWIPSSITAPYYWGSVDHDPQLPLDDFGIKISHSINYYFGYVSQFSNSVIFENLSQQKKNIMLSLEDLQNGRRRLAKYRTIGEIPLPAKSRAISLIDTPKVELGALRMFGVRTSNCK